MQELTDYYGFLSSYLYSDRERNILTGAIKNVSSAEWLRLFDKTVRLGDAQGTMLLTQYAQ